MQNLSVQKSTNALYYQYKGLVLAVQRPCTVIEPQFRCMWMPIQMSVDASSDTSQSRACMS